MIRPRRLLLFALVALVLVLAGLSFAAGGIAGRALERAGEEALGVETRVGSLRLGFLSGGLDLGGLEVANPAGYGPRDFLTLGRGELAVSLGSLLSDQVELPRVELEAIELNLEQRLDGSNYGALLEHLRRGAGSGGSGGKRFVIRELVIRDVTASFALALPAGEASRAQVTVPELVLTDVGSGGRPLREVVGEVVAALLGAVLEGAADLPAELRRELERVLSGVERELGAVGGEVGGKVGEILEDVGRGLEDVLDGAAKGVQNALGGDE